MRRHKRQSYDFCIILKHISYEDYGILVYEFVFSLILVANSVVIMS